MASEHQVNPQTCPTCSKPLAGSGRCTSALHRAIGFYRLGATVAEGLYLLDRRGELMFARDDRHVEVIDLIESRDDWMAWSVTVRELDGPDAGRIRTHCTAWDPKHLRLVSNAKETSS